MDAALLPQQQILSQSSYTGGANRGAPILGMADDVQKIRVKAGSFTAARLPIAIAPTIRRR